MANLNRVLILGRCTRNPDVRYTPKGTAIADIGIAVNRWRHVNPYGTHGEEAADGLESAWGAPALADTDPDAR